jgi:hypothetical protein
MTAITERTEKYWSQEDFEKLLEKLDSPNWAFEYLGRFDEASDDSTGGERCPID